MSLQIDLQLDCGSQALPEEALLRQWASHAYLHDTAAEVCVRVVEIAEMQTLNHEYRGKDKATNVLSFCADLPPGITLDVSPLGDIAICAAVVADEASAQHKTLNAHWAHMLIHGMLHLQGFDHINDDDAEVMEAKEISLLAALDYPSPYEGRE